MFGCRQHGTREKFFILTSKVTPQWWSSCLQRGKTTWLKMHRVWNTTNRDIKIHPVPVAFSDAVEDGRFVFLSVSERGTCVAEKQPVSDTELRQQTSLHHLIQIISRRTPQTAGEQRLFCAQLLTKHHITRSLTASAYRVMEAQTTFTAEVFVLHIIEDNVSIHSFVLLEKTG